MFCSKCGKAVQEGAAYCANCGHAGEAAPAAASAAAATGFGGTAAAGTGLGGNAAARALPGILERVKNILLTPKSEWPVIDSETTSAAQLYTGYVIPLAGIAAVLSFLRMSLIGISMPFGGVYRTPLVTGLVSAAVSFGCGLLGLYLVALIINALAPTFAGTRDQRQALKTAAYAFTPAWLGALLGLLPVFSTLLQLAAGIYGIYLLALGLPRLMRSPREKAAGYTAAVVVCTMVLGLAFGALLALTGRMTGLGGIGGMSGTTLSPAERQARAAATVGNAIGGALGTDQKGRADLAAAMTQLAEAGRDRAAPGATADSSAATATAAQQPADPQAAVAATAGLLTALGGAMSGGRHVEPVDFHTLKGLLPDALPGMHRTNSEGSSQQAMGIKTSSATAHYEGSAGMRAEIKIADVSGVSGLLDAAGAMVQDASSESDTSYERNSTVGGRVVHEKYDNQSKHGELNALIAKRFSVDVTGDGVDMATLEQTVAGLDLAKLDGLKDAGVQTP